MWPELKVRYSADRVGEEFPVLRLIKHVGEVTRRVADYRATMSRGPRREYTETLQEVAMDKPRHPQVIRPWKTQRTHKNKWSPPPTREPQRERGKKRGKYAQETYGGRTLGVLKTRDSRQIPPALGPISFQIL
jgi:hypothetical protein